jgi:hypothetical protein
MFYAFEKIMLVDEVNGFENMEEAQLCKIIMFYVFEKFMLLDAGKWF